MSNDITKFIWYNSRESYIEIDYHMEMFVIMRKKPMKYWAEKLNVPFEVRKKR